MEELKPKHSEKNFKGKALCAQIRQQVLKYDIKRNKQTGYYKLKSSVLQKMPSKKSKRDLQPRRKRFQIIELMKDLCLKCIENYFNLII